LGRHGQLGWHAHPVYLMPDAAVRIHHAEETFEGCLLENERSCETSNHCSYYHYGVHFHVLRLQVEQSACQSPEGGASGLAGHAQPLPDQAVVPRAVQKCVREI
jgi:hypothetical protein